LASYAIRSYHVSVLTSHFSAFSFQLLHLISHFCAFHYFTFSPFHFLPAVGYFSGYFGKIGHVIDRSPEKWGIAELRWRIRNLAVTRVTENRQLMGYEYP
jgi:hypothetical protein